MAVVLVRLASAEPAASDIQVTLALDPAAVTAYNALHGTSYVVPAPGLYTLPSMTVTIPKGSREGKLQLKAIPNNLFGPEYALGFKLANVSDPNIKMSGNFNTQVVGLTIRNKYDGIYAVVSGTVTRYTAPGVPANDALSGSVAGNPDMPLITVGANSVELTNLQWANSGGGVGGIES